MVKEYKIEIKHPRFNDEFFGFKEIVTGYNNSKPEIILKKKLDYKFSVSVSHEKDFAIAMVIAFKQNKL